MTRERILSIFERRRDAWNRHDAGGLTADYTEDAVLMSPYVGRVIGHGEIQRVYESLFGGFQDLEYGDETLVVENDQVAQFFSLAGTHSGEFMGMPATNRRFECHVSSLFTMRANRICFERRVYDFSGLLIQIGLLKAKPA